MEVKILTPDQAAELCDCSPATLERYRRDMTGPNFLRMPGGHVKYLQEDVLEWLKSLRQQPTEAQKMQAALMEGSAERKAALQERTRAMQQLDKADLDSLNSDSGVGGVTPLTVSAVGETPGSKFEKFNAVPAVPWAKPADPHIIEGR